MMERGWERGLAVSVVKRSFLCHWLFGATLFLFTGWLQAVPQAFGEDILTAPNWAVGMQWEVAVSKQSTINAGDPSKNVAAASTWIFKVERELLVDDSPAVVIRTTRKAAEDHSETYLLYFLASTATLSRVEALPQGMQGKKITHDFRRSAAGPTVVRFGSIPLSMPLFGTADGNGEFTYTHCINGPNGFVRKVAQAMEIQSERKHVRLESGSIRIEQEWDPDLPWPLVHSVDGGRVIAEFVRGSLQSPTLPEAGGSQPQGALRLNDVNTIKEFGSPRTGRWWPASARVSRRPWSSSAGIKVLSTTTMSATDAATSHPAWSGYFWPQYDDGEGVHLWDEDGPLDKYDYYVQARTGGFPSPYATTWEYENHRTLDPDNGWWGHCNGWTSAAILEPEPATASWAEGVYFSVADKKGILTEWHNDTGDDGFWGGRYDDAQDDPEDIYPYEFITVLIQYIYNQDEAVAMDLDCREEVWNHPIYGYYLEVLEEGENASRFYCEIYYALDDVRPDYVGTSESIAKLEFWCTVDAAGNFTPDASSWAGDSIDAHPDFLWHPVASTRYGQGNSALEQAFVDEIMASRPTEFASIEIRHSFRGDLTIRLGNGDPEDPDWLVVLSDQEGESAADFIADVDLSGAAEYLPPGPATPWFLEVTDHGENDEGEIQSFSITVAGQEYIAQDLPLAILDLETSLVRIGPEPEPANAAPAADAGGDQSVVSGTLVTLDGSGSSDPEDAIQSYRWEQTAGTSVTLSAAASAQTTFMAPAISGGSEILTFRLTVTDQGLLQDTDTCSITVAAKAHDDPDTDTPDGTYQPGSNTNSESSGGGGGGCFLGATGF